MSDAEQKRYTAVAIPTRAEQAVREAALPCPKKAASSEAFYEIEYDACPIPGVGKFVRKPLPITAPERDAIRERFWEMRQLSTTVPLPYASYSFFNQLQQQRNAAVFYKQAVFMRDFTDDYKERVPFSQYFPYYQLMGYEQLRTYFTWRTQVRSGNISDTSLSYAFLYVYELLNNIGVATPQEGLEKLMTFRRAFCAFQPSMEPYLLRWLKDYHIYYGLPQSFADFAAQNGLTAHYPELAAPQDRFSLYCAVSGYNLRKSVFYTPERAELVQACFCFTAQRLEEALSQIGLHLDDAVFQPTKKMPTWTPFKGALFYPWYRQPDRQVVLSEKERYCCRDNLWSFSAVLTDVSGKTLLTYLLKQMEAALRAATGYKRRLTANPAAVTHSAVSQLQEKGILLPALINCAVADFYREKTKIVVRVDAQALTRIRHDALKTQEVLLVPEEATATIVPIAPVPQPIVPSESSSWPDFFAALTPLEQAALRALLLDELPLKQFADRSGIMPEVLADGMNEKAFDCMGDNLLDDDFSIYEEYQQPLQELVGTL